MSTGIGLGLCFLCGMGPVSPAGTVESAAKNPISMLEVIPQPRQVEAAGSGFAPSKSRVIRVSDTVADRFSAVLLRDALRETEGIDCDIVPLTLNSGEIHRLSLSANDDAPAAAQAVSAGPGEEGYGLRVGPTGMVITASTDTGLFYGVQTAIQLAEQARRDKAAIPGVAIADWPAFGIRARYFDGSQYMGSEVTTRANLEREIRLLARYKLNCLIVETYNLVPFQSFPYCADSNTLSLTDWRYLVELGRRHHVILMPSLQSFAQIQQVIWNCQEGKPYREETAPGLICPSRPESVRFLQGLYKDLMTVFKYTPCLGIGCSEVGMQWQERYCPLCRKRLDAGETLQDIYCQHVCSCAAAVDAAAKELGRPVRPMMWADEFYLGYGGKRWIGIDRMPKNLVMGHWQYWSRYPSLPDHKGKDYDGITGLLQRGFDVIFLSASFEFNTYLHDLSPDDPKEGKWEVLYDAGICNIADQAQWAYVHDREGHPGKVLGGGCATFSQHDIRCWDTTWYAYLLQAEYSWGDPTRPLPDEKNRFTDRFAASFYGARDRQTARTIASAYRDLDAAKSEIERNNYLIRDIIGEYDIHDSSYVANDLAGSIKLIVALLANPQEPGKTAQDVRKRAQAVLKTARDYRVRLAALIPNVGNTSSLRYLIHAAHKMENHATRTLYMLDQEETLARLGTARAAAAWSEIERDLDELAKRLDGLRRDTQVIADEVDQLAFASLEPLNWNGAETQGPVTPLSADTTGYHRVLASLAEFEKRLAAARGARHEQQGATREGP